MLEELVIQYGAPTLAGLKSGSLFSFACESRDALLSGLKEINRKLSRKGLYLLPLRFGNKRTLLYLFRPAELKKDLRCPCAREILTQAGYDDLRLSRCVHCLMERLEKQEDFPHEIGLFLSYPPEDVQGFIDNKAKNYKCICAWKVYGDEESAQRTHDKYRKCTESYCRSYRAGRTLEELAVAI